MCRRHADLSLNVSENRALCAHLYAGGVTSWLYGGNANFYNLGAGEFESEMSTLATIAAEVGATGSAAPLVIPSVGPDYGKMMDQAKILARMDFKTAMVLPLDFPATAEGSSAGIRAFAKAFGKKVIVYVKSDKVWTPSAIEDLVKEGLVVAVKYAIVREVPDDDPFLSELCDRIGSKMIISGIGERPAAAHFCTFNVAGFTSGSVCVAPRLSTAILTALHAGDRAKADSLREHFLPLEDLRDAWSPIRTMHEAVTLSGVGNMGPMLPMLSNLSSREADLPALKKAARGLLAANAAAQAKI